jgi:anti-anti-sigma factor
MSVWHRQLADDIYLVAISGRLDQEQTPELEQRFQELIVRGHIRLVVDLSEVTYINSGGLRSLVTAWRQTGHLGGSLVLCGLSPRLGQLFAMVGFDKVFPIVQDWREAETMLLNS